MRRGQSTIEWLLIVSVLAIGLAVAAGILWYEHRLVKPGDLSRLDAAFFTMNGVMSVVVFAFALTDRILG